MALTDCYTKAKLLDSLSWSGLSEQTRIARLAAAYVKDEERISNHSRRYDGPTDRTVTLFVRSLYVPPRGEMKHVVAKVMAEIKRQKDVRTRRINNLRWKAPSPMRKLRPFERKGRILKRLDDLAKERFSGVITDYKGRLTRSDGSVIPLRRIGDALIIHQKGQYRQLGIVYFLDRKAGIEFAVTGNWYGDTVIDVLFKMAPKDAVNRMFMGGTVKLDLLSRSFIIDGQQYPWSGVVGTYEAGELHQIPLAGLG